MKYVLIMLIFSSWDGELISKTELGVFDSLKTCDIAIEKVKKEQTYRAAFICTGKNQ